MHATLHNYFLMYFSPFHRFINISLLQLLSIRPGLHRLCGSTLTLRHLQHYDSLKLDSVGLSSVFYVNYFACWYLGNTPERTNACHCNIYRVVCVQVVCVESYRNYHIVCLPVSDSCVAV